MRIDSHVNMYVYASPQEREDDCDHQTTIMPAPEINDILIGRSTLTTSNITLPINEIHNKTETAEPVGGIK
jgi:hypothetical protein